MRYLNHLGLCVSFIRKHAFNLTRSSSIPSFLYLFIRDPFYLDNAGWTLRKASKPASVVTVFFSLLIMIVLSFPTQSPIKPSELLFVFKYHADTV
jgi:hypothetical protein